MNAMTKQTIWYKRYYAMWCFRLNKTKIYACLRRKRYYSTQLLLIKTLAFLYRYLHFLKENVELLDSALIYITQCMVR